MIYVIFRHGTKGHCNLTERPGPGRAFEVGRRENSAANRDFYGVYDSVDGALYVPGHGNTASEESVIDYAQTLLFNTLGDRPQRIIIVDKILKPMIVT